MAKTRSNMSAGFLRVLVKQENLHTFLRAVDISIKRFSQKTASQSPPEIFKGTCPSRSLPLSTLTLHKNWTRVRMARMWCISIISSPVSQPAMLLTCSQSASQRALFSFPSLETPDQNKGLTEQSAQHIIFCLSCGYLLLGYPKLNLCHSLLPSLLEASSKPLKYVTF